MNYTPWQLLCGAMYLLDLRRQDVRGVYMAMITWPIWHCSSLYEKKNKKYCSPASNAWGSPGEGGCECESGVCVILLREQASVRACMCVSAHPVAPMCFQKERVECVNCVIKCANGTTAER